MTPSCRWDAPDSRSVDVGVIVDTDYLAAVYRTRLFPIFRPTDIAGLPAVEQQAPVDPSSCNIVVGTADNQALDVEAGVDRIRPDGAPAFDPCTEGRKVIEAIVSTLPPL